LFERLERALVGAASGIDAVLVSGKSVRVEAGGASERVLLWSAIFAAAVLVLPHLGFDGAVAAEEPLAVDEFVETMAGFGGDGSVAVVVLGYELFEIGDLFGGEDEGLGVKAGFQGIHGGAGLACDGGGACGFLGVAAVGFDLTLRGHK
jgi:hypothetical protein